MAAAPHLPPHRSLTLIKAGNAHAFETKGERASFGSGDLLTPLLGALSVLLLLLLVLRKQEAGVSAWFRGFPRLGWRRRRRYPHLPPRPFLPPPRHQQLHDEKYLSRILEADRQPPHP